MHCIIFSGGGVVDGFFVQESIKFADLIIAADSGADAALEFDVIPSVILGDFDSLDTQTQKQLKEKNIECISYNSNKDETDTELAVTYAIKKGATKISILGGTEGNRIDHVLGNIFLSSSSLKCKIVFITGRQKFWIV